LSDPRTWLVDERDPAGIPTNRRRNFRDGRNTRRRRTRRRAGRSPGPNGGPPGRRAGPSSAGGPCRGEQKKNGADGRGEKRRKIGPLIGGDTAGRRRIRWDDAEDSDGSTDKRLRRRAPTKRRRSRRRPAAKSGSADATTTTGPFHRTTPAAPRGGTRGRGAPRQGTAGVRHQNGDSGPSDGSEPGWRPKRQRRR